MKVTDKIPASMKKVPRNVFGDILVLAAPCRRPEAAPVCWRLTGMYCAQATIVWKVTVTVGRGSIPMM